MFFISICFFRCQRGMRLCHKNILDLLSLLLTVIIKPNNYFLDVDKQRGLE